MKTYLKSTTRIVLFTACMGGLAACSDNNDNDKKSKKADPPVTKVKKVDPPVTVELPTITPPTEETIKEKKDISDLGDVSQFARLVKNKPGARILGQTSTKPDGVPVTGKLMVSGADSKADVNKFLAGSVAGYKVQLAGDLKKKRTKDDADFKATLAVGGTLYEGKTTVNGVEYEYHLYENSKTSVIAGYLDNPNNPNNPNITGDWTGLTLGAQASKLPTGTHKYSGYNKLGKGDDSAYGDFGMTVNFSEKLITKFGAKTINDGDATGNDSVVTGIDIPVDVAHGTFRGDITATGTFVGGTQDRSGEVYGDFHGVGATGVSGMYDVVDPPLFETSDNSPTITGMFAGSKQ